MKTSIYPCISLIWRLSIGCLLTTTQMAQVAQAYVPPVEGLLRGWVEQRRQHNNKDMTLHLQCELLPLDSEPGASGDMVEERWYVQKGERSRLVRLTEPEWVEIYKMGQGWLGKAGTSGQRHRQIDPFVLLWWAEGDDVAEIKQRIWNELKRFGVDVETSSLGRMGEEVYYIIGAKSYETGKAQLWLNKTTLLPSRFIFANSQGPTPAPSPQNAPIPGPISSPTSTGGSGIVNAPPPIAREIRWMEHGQGPALAGLPRLIEYWEQGVCVRKLELIKIEQQRLPSSLFELPTPS